MSTEKYRVLVVEDDPQLAKFYEIALSRTFASENVQTISDALDRIKKSPRIDGVVLDLVLPNGSGLDLIARVQPFIPEAPIVVVSGYSYKVEDVMAAGAADFMEKPYISADRLVAVVVRAIARHKVYMSCLAHGEKEVKPLLDLSARSSRNLNKVAELVESMRDGNGR